MSRTPFILPAGLVLRQDAAGLVVEYDGDIELSTDLGGRIALLNSTGGDVILNAALNVGEIKSAGAVRSTGDVRADRIDAASVAVDGDLRVTSIQSSGAVVCGGDIDADELRASSVQSSALRVNTLEASGEVETTGQTRLGRARASALRSGGDLEADELTLEGELATVGAAQIGTLSADSASVGGELKVGKAELAGSLSTGGDLDGSAIEAGGDVQIEGELRVDSANVSGHLQARSVTTQVLVATGGVSATSIQGRDSLTLGGDIRADRVDGGELRIDEGDVSVRIIVGTAAVHLGAISIKSDIVMAPTVTMDATASGRISVLESGTEPGTSRVKGCLSLEDLEELFGNSQQFLADRGLEAPGYGPRKAGTAPPPPARANTKAAKAAKAAKVAAAPPPPPPAAELEVEVEVEDPGDSMLASISPVAAEIHAAIEAEDDRTLDEMLDHEPDSPTNGADHSSALDSLIELSNVSEIDGIEEGSASVRVSSTPGPTIQVQAEGEEDLFGWADQMLTEVVSPDAIKGMDIDLEMPTGNVEPILEPELVPEPAEDPIHGQIQETVGKIVTCYLHTEMPPAVSRLKDLVEARDYGRVRSDITEIWNQLLKFHQKRGMRIQPQVTTTFNTINSLVRKL